MQKDFTNKSMKDLINLFKLELEAQSRLNSNDYQNAIKIYNEIYIKRIQLKNFIGAIKALCIITKTYFELGNELNWKIWHKKLIDELEQYSLNSNFKKDFYKNLIDFYEKKQRFDIIEELNKKFESV